VGASLAQTGTFIQTPFMIDYQGRTWDEPAGQQAKGWGPLDRLYRAADRWFYLGAVGPDAHDRLAAVAGLGGTEGLSGSDLEAALSARFATAPAETWVERLTAAGIGGHILRHTQEVMEDPWAKAHRLSVERDFPELGRVRTIGPTGRLSRTPLRLNDPASPPGTHNREVLEEIGLGSRYDELMTSGVLASKVGPRAPVPA
jgi:crotonobetainyl-CoA:carnitine CoA-transferase CaiB-like acyl-CoA transferase